MVRHVGLQPLDGVPLDGLGRMDFVALRVLLEHTILRALKLVLQGSFVVVAVAELTAFFERFSLERNRFSVWLGPKLVVKLAYFWTSSLTRAWILILDGVLTSSGFLN